MCQRICAACLEGVSCAKGAFGRYLERRKGFDRLATPSVKEFAAAVCDYCKPVSVLTAAVLKLFEAHIMP